MAITPLNAPNDFGFDFVNNHGELNLEFHLDAVLQTLCWSGLPLFRTQRRNFVSGKWRFIGEIGKVTHFCQLRIISMQRFFSFFFFFCTLFLSGRKAFRGKEKLVLVRWLKLEPVSVANLFIHYEVTPLNPSRNKLLKRRFVLDTSWKRWNRNDWLTKHELNVASRFFLLQNDFSSINTFF